MGRGRTATGRGTARGACSLSKYQSNREENAMFEKLRIKEHMEVADANGQHVGTVDSVDDDQIKLTRTDSADGQASSAAARPCRKDRRQPGLSEGRRPSSRRCLTRHRSSSAQMTEQQVPVSPMRRRGFRLGLLLCASAVRGRAAGQPHQSRRRRPFELNHDPPPSTVMPRKKPKSYHPPLLGTA